MMLKKPKDTPYSHNAATLVDNGFSAIPVLPGAKFPGTRRYGEWVAETGWQRFCDRLPTDIETSTWSSWPDAGICVALGMNDVVAIDIDTNDEDITEAIMSVLPAPVVGKSGAKGKTYFYRASRAVVSRPYDIRRERVLDLLCHGRQTIIPPSIHPDTKRPYIWITDDTLSDVHFTDLPTLPDDIADKLTAVLEPFGYVYIPDLPAPQHGEDGPSDTPWGEVNRLALENFDAWVPALCLPATKRNGRGTYRAAAAWRGGDGPNVSFHPKGIKDMAQDKRLSAIDVVMLSRSVPFDVAFRWLAPLVGYQPPSSVNVTALLENAERRHQRGAYAVVSTDEGEFVELDDDKPDLYRAPSGDSLESLTYPGGLLEDMVDWITSSSPTPSRPLALSAVIPLMAAMIGRRYSTGSRDTRANIYTVALADSGFGKEHARSQLKRLIMASNGVFDSYSGPARIMSASALREVLEHTACVCCMIDEFGGFVRDITEKRAGSHQKAISTDLRDYYSASSTYFEGAAYRGTPAKKIHHPMLCIYGTSTPEQFWSALSSASAEDGLLPRLLLFNVDGKKPDEVEPAVPQHAAVPVPLLERLADVADIDVASTRLGDVRKRTQAAEPRPAKVVPWTPGAQSVFNDMSARVKDEEPLVAPEARPFVRRIMETSTKLALIAAVSDNPFKPQVSAGNMDWATNLAWTCAMTMIAEVTDRMADNEREANYKKIAGIIRKAGRDGIAEGRLIDRVTGIDARRREEIINDLVVSGSVMVESTKTKGRPKKRLVWL
jgi:hypothetical protein